MSDKGLKPGNLKTVTDWLRVSERFKLFPIRWKWRRTRLYQIITLLLILCLISHLPFVESVYSKSSYHGATTNHFRNQRLQKIWAELTPSEFKHIFGGSRKEMELVPSMELITPQVFHRKLKRKRSPSSHSLPPTESDEKIIELEGLGRSFRLTLHPNPSLLNLNDFVHLFRHENYSEILSDEIIKNQLHCFYHGSASHHHHHHKDHLPPTDHNYVLKEEKDEELRKGRVALDICDGLKGFIIPVEVDPYHHYVIHPVPKRFRKRRTLPEHFIWRKKQRVDPSTNDEFSPFHYEHHPRYQNPQVSSSSCGHDVNGAHAEQKTHQRTKRSHMNFDEDPAEASYHGYKPRNVASDSYWLRYRSTVTPLDDFKRAGNSYSSTYDPHRPSSLVPQGDTFGRHYSTDSYQSMSQSQQTPQTHSAPDYWAPTQGIPQHENQGQSIASARMDDSILGRGGSAYQSQQFPFYTRTNNGMPSSSNRWTNFDDNFNNYNYYNSSHLPSITVAPTSAQFYRQKSMIDRKGRGDNTIFGENYHSSLDSDLMATAHSVLAQTKVHREMEPAHLTIETAVFVDKDLYEHMQANFPDDTQAEVSRIVLAMVNAVQLLYQDPSLGHRVEFVLKRLEILATDPPGLLRPYDIDRFLTNFCKWQKTENPASDADPLHWDHALILTGLDLYVVHQSGKISNQVVGLAPVAGMCTRSSSCTVNEGRHFESVYVMAHEIGHNLGMRHDGPKADNECDPTAHIMSPTLGSGKITWSPCSKRYLDMFLETTQSKCLLDKAKSETRLDHDADGRLPGERFNADQQCVLKYGRGSYHATQQPIEDVCRDLHCRKQYYTWTSHPALEGTECGLEMSCRAGKCAQKSHINEVGNNHGGLGNVLFDRGSQMGQNSPLGMDGSETAAYSTLKALDGAWGQWSPYTDCSSACLNSDQGGVTESSTGVRLAARRCDSPRPENGGRQCSGLDRRYKTCSTEKICPGTSPRVTSSQYAKDVCGRAAAADTELTGSGFMSSAERACSVWCEISHGMGSRSRGWSFPDGTACKLSSRPNGSHFCIAGKCQEFTCDANSHFGLSDEHCSSGGKGGSTSWFGNRGGSGHDGGHLTTTFHRQEKAVWTKWESQSSCKLTCLVPGKGLQLVQRKCNLQEEGEGDIGNAATCSGLSLSVRLCKPDKSTILSNACTRFQTVFEHATKLCTKYSEKVAGLSGIGMQLAPTKDDSHRPCRIGCQDVALPYRFYMVNGEEGWFPAGTDCSRGEPNKKAYCLSGKCIDFGPDDTPVYRINAKVLGRLESMLRTKRDASRHSLMMDQGSLMELVHKFAAGEDGTAEENRPPQNPTALDFTHPIVVGDDKEQSILIQSHRYRRRNNILKNPQPVDIEGSFYEWRKIMSDCSAPCGKGAQEVIVECVSGETIVMDSMCRGSEKPGSSGYIPCDIRPCTPVDRQMNQTQNLFWSWIQSILPPRHLTYVT